MKIRDKVLEGLGLNEKKKIVVAMSGGVDSTTVAALLHDAGHEVVGVTLQLYDHGVAVNKKGACCAGVDIYDAQVAAELIGIPHYVFNYEGIFYDSVMKPFAESYAKGETPIPCILCNQKVKFKDLLSAAEELKADFMATGHYVKKRMENENAELHKALDKGKDQSYFLFTTTQRQLDKLLFPLGILNKSETRELAEFYGLNVADKAESQDICFVPNGNYRDIVRRIMPETQAKGNIVLESGEVIGEHDGIINYTIGQRRGISVSYPNPLYVLRIDKEKNEVIVGEKERLIGQRLEIIDMNWLDEAAALEEVVIVRLRSSHPGCPASLEMAADNSSVIVTLHEEGYFGITPGQACVIYNGDKVLGGGWIKKQLFS